MDTIKDVAITSSHNELTSTNISEEEKKEVSRLLTMLRYLSDSKMSFSRALQSIEKTCGYKLSNQVYVLLDESAKKYALLRVMLTKYAMAGAMKNEKLENIINDIFKLDFTILTIINEAIEDMLRGDEILK